MCLFWGRWIRSRVVAPVPLSVPSRLLRFPSIPPQTNECFIASVSTTEVVGSNKYLKKTTTT